MNKHDCTFIETHVVFLICNKKNSIFCKKKKKKNGFLINHPFSAKKKKKKKKSKKKNANAILQSLMSLQFLLLYC
jgi:hypothetical protein